MRLLVPPQKKRATNHDGRHDMWKPQEQAMSVDIVGGKKSGLRTSEVYDALEEGSSDLRAQ
eukprot:8663275-Pyramimonas_sp.AAC.1